MDDPLNAVDPKHKNSIFKSVISKEGLLSKKVNFKFKLKVSWSLQYYLKTYNLLVLIKISDHKKIR